MLFHIYCFRLCSITEILCEKLSFLTESTESNLGLDRDIRYILICADSLLSLVFFIGLDAINNEVVTTRSSRTRLGRFFEPETKLENNFCNEGRGRVCNEGRGRGIR